jgi:hypothetical protein
MEKREIFEVTTKRGTLLEVTVGIKDVSRGWFELYDEKTGGEVVYAEGGLWFREKYLVDYDGVGELPDYIMEKLEEMGYSMDQL